MAESTVQLKRLAPETTEQGAQLEHSIDTRQVWNGMWRSVCSCGKWSLFVSKEEEALYWADTHSRHTDPSAGR